jgi:ribosome-associated protein
MDDLPISKRITIPSADFEVSYARSGGPGGQHANTADTRVRVHFDLQGTDALHPAVKQRIREAYGNRINKEGQLVLTSDTHRSRHRNLDEVRERLANLIRGKLQPPKKRKKTRISLGAKKRRMKAKKRRSELKKQRGKVDW